MYRNISMRCYFSVVFASQLTLFAFGSEIKVHNFRLKLTVLGSNAIAAGSTDAKVRELHSSGYTVNGDVQFAVSESMGYQKTVVPFLSKSGASAKSSYFYYENDLTYDQLGALPRVRTGDYRRSAYQPGYSLFIGGYWHGKASDLEDLRRGTSEGVKVVLGPSTSWLFSERLNDQLVITERKRNDPKGPIFCRYTFREADWEIGKPVKVLKIEMGYPKIIAVHEIVYIGVETLKDPLAWIKIGTNIRDSRLGPDRVVETTWTGGLSEQTPSKPTTTSGFINLIRSRAAETMIVTGCVLILSAMVIRARRVASNKRKPVVTSVPETT